MNITVEYNLFGYTVLQGNREIYCAGNHRKESTTITDSGTLQALTLREIRRFAIHTAKEISREKGVEFGGATRIEYEDET